MSPLWCCVLLYIYIMYSVSFHVETLKKTWWAANAYCQTKYGTHLITITDSTMNANIANEIKSVSWIGCFHDGSWKWIGYNQSSYMNWYWTYDDSRTYYDSDCCQMWYTSNRGGWDDANCGGQKAFVCAEPDDYPSDSTTSVPTTTYSPTTSSIKVLSTKQTINDMKEVRYNIVCSNLMDNYDLIYEITLKECITICQNMGDLCRMIHFYHYFKTDDDSRCYIFQSICKIVDTYNNETDQSSIYYKVSDDKLCVNYPTDWVDHIGDNCEAYLMYDWCNNSVITRNEDDFYELMNRNYGLDAIDTCCECGGGANIVDDIAVSIDTDWIDSNTDILCGVSLQNKSTSRDWDNLYLYHFCDSLQQINCAYLLNTNFNPTNYSYSMYLCNNTSSQSEDNDFQFIVDVQINDDHLFHDTYINLQWFNIDATSLYSSNINIIYLNHAECIHSLLYIDSNNTHNYGIHPCYSLDTNNTTNESTETTNEAINSTSVSIFMSSHSLTISSVSDIVDAPPSENMSNSESDGTVLVIIISVLLLCLLFASIAIAFLKRKLNIVEMKENETEGDNYNDNMIYEASAPDLDGNETKTEQDDALSDQAIQ